MKVFLLSFALCVLHVSARDGGFNQPKGIQTRPLHKPETQKDPVIVPVPVYTPVQQNPPVQQVPVQQIPVQQYPVQYPLVQQVPVQQYPPIQHYPQIQQIPVQQYPYVPVQHVPVHYPQHQVHHHYPQMHSHHRYPYNPHNFHEIPC